MTAPDAPTPPLSPERRAALRRLAEKRRDSVYGASDWGHIGLEYARGTDAQTVLDLLDAADQAEAAEQRAAAATRWSALWKRAARFNLRTRRPLEKHATLRLQQMAEHQSALESEHAAALRQAEAWRRRAEAAEAGLRLAIKRCLICRGAGHYVPRLFEDDVFVGYGPKSPCPECRRYRAALADAAAREGGAG